MLPDEERVPGKAAGALPRISESRRDRCAFSSDSRPTSLARLSLSLLPLALPGGWARLPKTDLDPLRVAILLRDAPLLWQGFYSSNGCIWRFYLDLQSKEGYVLIMGCMKTVAEQHMVQNCLYRPDLQSVETARLKSNTLQVLTGR